LEWSCTCFASAGPFDARFEISNSNNCTLNAIAIPDTNVDDCIHPNADAIPDTISHTVSIPDSDAITNNCTYSDSNDGAYPNSNNCTYSDSNVDGGTHPNTNALLDDHADDFNIAIGIRTLKRSLLWTSHN
jgi:hypothetical protein